MRKEDELTRMWLITTWNERSYYKSFNDNWCDNWVIPFPPLLHKCIKNWPGSDSSIISFRAILLLADLLLADLIDRC